MPRRESHCTTKRFSSLQRSVFQEFIRPGDEVLPVRSIRVSAVVLTPCELAVEQCDIHLWHFLGLVIVAFTEVLCAQETKYRLCCDRSHVASLVIEPLGVTLFRYAIADKNRTRRAQCDQFVRVYWKIAGVSAAEVGFRGAILEEVACHPMVFARAGQVFHLFSPVAAM